MRLIKRHSRSVQNCFLLLLLFLSLYSTVLCSLVSSSSGILSDQLDQDYSFDYNSTYSSETFNIEFRDVELSEFNVLTLFFITSGDKTTSEGLVITFIWNDIVIKFRIDRLLQDHQEHNISETFDYDGGYSGNLNVSATFEGQSAMGSSGSIYILESSFIKNVSVPTILETPTQLPVIPNYLTFQGSFFTSVSREIKTAIYCINPDFRVNLSISFTTNSFNALDQTIEIFNQSNRIRTLKFQASQTELVCCSFQLQEGFHVLSIVFTVTNSIDLIDISNIELWGFAYAVEDLVPNSVYDWFFWENELVEYTFDLTQLKPEAIVNDIILTLNLFYGYHGSINPSSLTYKLFVGSYSNCYGEFCEVEPTELIHKEILRTYTTSYSDDLKLTISFSTRGEGVFYLLNTTNVEIEVIPTLQNNNTLERLLEEERTIFLPENEIFLAEYYDVFQVSALDYSSKHFILTFDIISESGQVMEKVDIIVNSGFQVIIEESAYNKSSFRLMGSIKAISYFMPIKVLLCFYGCGNQISLQNLEYRIEVNVEENANNLEERSISTESKWVFFGSIILEVFYIFSAFIAAIKQKLPLIKSRKNQKKKPKISLKNRVWGTLDWIIIGHNRILRIFIGLTMVGWIILTSFAIQHVVLVSESIESINYSIGANVDTIYAGILIIPVGAALSFLSGYFISTIFLNLAFFEDRLLKTLLLVISSEILQLTGWLLTLLSTYSNPHFSDIWMKLVVISSLQLLMSLLIIAFCVRLGKKRATKFKTTLLEVLKLADFRVEREILTKSLQEGIVHRLEIQKETVETKRNRLEDSIMFKILSNEPISVKKLSTLSGIEYNLTWNLLEDILEADPYIGIFDKQRQNFTKLSRKNNPQSSLMAIPLAKEKNDSAKIEEIYQESAEKSKLEPIRSLTNLFVDLNLDRNTERLEDVHFISSRRDGSFSVNQNLIEIIDDLKKGKTIKIKEIVKGEHVIVEQKFTQIANEANCIRILIEQFLYNLEDLVEYLNEKQKEFFKQRSDKKQKFGDLVEEEKTQYFNEFSRYIYVELTTGELFTEDSFLNESGLFSGKSYNYYQKIKPMNAILVKFLSATMRGELAIVLVFLHSLLLMKSQQNIESRTKFQYVANHLANKLQRKTELAYFSGVKNFTITNYYNPFIRIEFSAEQNNKISIEGWRFRHPEDITYKDGIWFDKLPFVQKEEKKILRIIKKEWNKPQGFSENVSKKSLAAIKKEMKGVYRWKDKQLPIEMLYVHNRYYCNDALEEFKAKIQRQINDFPKQSSDWYPYLIYRQEMGYIQGKDMFDNCQFIFCEAYSDENKNIKARFIPDIDGNFEQDAIIEIESKSSYHKVSPYAVRYQEFGYTTNLEKKYGGIYVNEKNLKLVTKRFLDGMYDICIENEGKKKSLRQELGLSVNNRKKWANKRNFNRAFKILNNSKFDIMSKRVDRIETKTSVSGQKHLLRRLVNAVEKNPELTSSYEWYDKITSKNVEERNRNFVILIDNVLKKNEEYEGLIFHEEIRELISNYNSFILYYNLLLFSSGYPVLTFNSNFLKYDFYLPQEFYSKGIIATNTSTPTWKSITGGLTRLANSSMDLCLKIRLPSQERENRIVTITESTFQKPLRVQKKESIKQVYAIRIQDEENEGVFVVSQDGYKLRRIKSVKNNDVLELEDTEKIYGGAIIDTKLGDFSEAFAKDKLLQLLLFGGKQYNGLTIGAIANLFNQESNSRITGKRVKIPFLHFLLVASNDSSGNNQVMSLAYPILAQKMKMAEEATKRDLLKFKFRPAIEGIAYYTLNSLLGTKVDLSVAFGDNTKFYDEEYWASGKYRTEKMSSVSKVSKGRKGDVSKIVFAFKHVFNNILGEKRKIGIGRINFPLYVKENRKTNQLFFSKEKLDKNYIIRKISIPLASKKAVSSETYTWYQTIAKAPMILLTDADNPIFKGKTKESTNLKNRHRAAVNFIKMIDEITDELPQRARETKIWKILKEIRNKYAISNSIQIDSKDWATIINTLFPEIVKAPTIPYTLRKAHLSEFNITKLDLDAPDPASFVRLFNDDTTRFGCYSPYNTLYNFIGIFLMSNWKISSKSTGRTTINYPLNEWSQPDIVIKSFLINWVTFLLYRAQSLHDFFLDPSKKFDIFDLDKMLDSKFISNEFHEIMKYRFEDVKRGVTQIEGLEVDIPIIDQILWMLVKESQYADTFSFKLETYNRIQKPFREFVENYNRIGLDEHKINEFILSFSKWMDN